MRQIKLTTDSVRFRKNMERSASADPALRPLRIFVVENHADTRQLLALYLEGMGHTVFCAGTMQDALAKLPDARCDVLLSDIGLPDGDGWELLRRIAGHGRFYAIAMSGFGAGTTELKSKQAGYRRCLLKPFVPDELDRALAEAAQEFAAAA